MNCRLCGADALTSVVDLGATPPCERFLRADQLDDPETTYPLHLRLCRQCMLLQIPALITPEDTFTEYAYFSSYADTWVEHAKRFVTSAVERLGLDETSMVVEVASNDGYLLQHVVEQGIPCVGIEPSVNVGEAAREKGVRTVTAFLGPETAREVREEYGAASLVVANNVYAHIPDLIGFTEGLRTLVADDGWISIEVHHALNLVRYAQFDTIYHEHFQYYTLLSAQNALATADLAVADVELLDTHGGSLRIWARPAAAVDAPSDRVRDVLALERDAGLHDPAGYAAMEEHTRVVRVDLLGFLLDCRRQGKRVVGYGAPGKGNTLLNYCGIRPDLLEYTVDRNPYKHGRFTPGTRIPIHPPERIYTDRPDVIVILPWNLADEITVQLSDAADWGAEFHVPITQQTTTDQPVSAGG